jgi:hypothetical protein
MGLVRSAITGGEAMTRSRPTPKRVRWDDRPGIHPNAAGLDIGARAIVVAVPPARDAEPVRVLAPFTPARHARVDGLLQCGIDTVAMASTGVYGVPVFALRARSWRASQAWISWPSRGARRPWPKPSSPRAAPTGANSPP